MADIAYTRTPNPDSLKFTREDGRFIETGLESFASAAEAAGHALGASLFGVSGVANVLILPDFVTVTKTPGASWDVVLPGVRSILEAT